MTRKTFLEYSVATGAGLLFSSLESFAMEKTEQKIRVAIIGCGSVSNPYVWQEGATKISEALLNKTEPRINVEHSLHVLEIIEAARKSSAKGVKVKFKSRFPWTMV